MKTLTLDFNIPVNGRPYKDKIELSRFINFVPKRHENDQKEIEMNLNLFGNKKPYYIWVTDTEPTQYHLLMGHSEMEFTIKNDLPFTILRLKFSSENEVRRFIIRNTIFDSMSLFQKGGWILQNKDVLSEKGKLNMISGGKGEEVNEKVNTMKELSELIHCSTQTLYKISYIIENLKDEIVLRKLEMEEISISKVFNDLMEVTISRNEFCFQLQETKESVDTPIEKDVKVINIQERKKSIYDIDESDQYPVIFVKPNWGLKKSENSKQLIDQLKLMNLLNISYGKFSTLFIQVPTIFLNDSMEVISKWGFNVVDTIVVSLSSSRSQSNYSEHYNDLLLICERNNVGVPKMNIPNISTRPFIPEEEVMEVIDSMFNKKLDKVGIFTGDHDGWDTFNFDSKNKRMVKFLKKMG
ncbi:MAG: hypothetical protein WCR72_09480 [Bacteroidota bacterium]